MPVLEFTDSEGRSWRAWDIAPSARRSLAVPDAPGHEAGWIVFEMMDASEKRRLAPYPTDWATMPGAGLEALLAKAVAVKPSKRTGANPHAPAQSRPDASHQQPPERRAVRSFRYPGGRLWTVCVFVRPEVGGSAVLRFSAGARHVELHDWPREWASFTDDDLIDLLRGVHRPEQTTPGSRTLDAQRRHSDRVG